MSTQSYIAGSIGFGVAELLLEAGALVTVISSSSDSVTNAVQRLNHPHAQGKVGDVREEAAFTELLISLAPLDHIVFSSVGRFIRGTLAEADLDDAKQTFGVKFWGSLVVGKGKLTSSQDLSSFQLMRALQSHCQPRYH